MNRLFALWNFMTGLFGFDPVEDCGCVGRARKLLTAIGYSHCGIEAMYTWSFFKIRDAAIEGHHFRATVVALFIRVVFPTWPPRVKPDPYADTEADQDRDDFYHESMEAMLADSLTHKAERERSEEPDTFGLMIEREPFARLPKQERDAGVERMNAIMRRGRKKAREEEAEAQEIFDYFREQIRLLESGEDMWTPDEIEEAIGGLE